MGEVKTIQLNISEGQFSDVKAYANDNGVSIEQAYIDLANRALKAGQLMAGSVSTFSPEAQETIKALQVEALKKYDEDKVAAIPAPAPTPEPTPVPEATGNIIFTANDDIKELVNKINETRRLKGLAPLEQSLAEMLLHWGQSLSDNSGFNDTTGLDFSWFKSKATELALAEREKTGAQSNVIVAKGIFSSYSIVETPTENK